MPFTSGIGVDDDNRMPVEVAGVLDDGTDYSTTVSVGGVAQELFPAAAARRGWSFQNRSSASLYLRSRGADGTANATTNHLSVEVLPGAYYSPEWVTPYAMSVIGATAGQGFFARSW